jgi:RNA polymerase sigma-70 factor (ECF subfamily)
MKIATDEVDAHSVGSDPDAMLALRARNDPEAFGLLYARYVHRVISYFLLRTGNREDAEDLASQCFVRAFEALPRFRAGEGSVRSWLFAIAHNLAVSHFRAHRKTTSIETVTILDHAPPLDEHAIHGDDLHRLRTALGTLTDQQRRVIELRLAGLSGIEISKAAGKSHAAVKMLQHRALEQLRLALGAPAFGTEATHEH